MTEDGPDHEVTDPDGTEYTWRDQMVGERMAVDQEFSGRIADSELSNQEWGMIMTAVSFEIENSADPEKARLVADTSKVEHVIPEMEKLQDASGMGMPGGAAGGSRGSGGSGGFLGSVKDALGLGGDDDGTDDEVLARADALTREYAGKLQTRLEDNGKWTGIRKQAAVEYGIDPETVDAGTDAHDGAAPGGTGSREPADGEGNHHHGESSDGADDGVSSDGADDGESSHGADDDESSHGADDRESSHGTDDRESTSEEHGDSTDDG